MMVKGYFLSVLPKINYDLWVFIRSAFRLAASKQVRWWYRLHIVKRDYKYLPRGALKM